MIYKLNKRGNSFTIQIKKSYVKQLGWGPGTQLLETVEDGKLVLEAVKNPVPTLTELLDNITPENLHNEIDFGPAVGNENW